MQDLHSGDIQFAPNVRYCKAFSETTNCQVNNYYDLCAFHIENARKTLEEMKPNDSLIDTIRPIFEGDVVPDIILDRVNEMMLSFGEFEIEFAKGEYNAASKRIQNEISNEPILKERLIMSAHYGRIAIKEGNTEEGVQYWWNVISQADTSYKFEIAKIIAEHAALYELHHEAIEFYETALQAEYIVFAKTKDFAIALRGYAEALQLCGQQDKADESWQQAVNLFKDTGNYDELALTYWYWGKTKQDHQAEVLLEEAIKYWKHEPDIFDETLSHIYHDYASCLGMQGHLEEARAAAQKAISLYPSYYYPEYLEEDIQEYL